MSRTTWLKFGGCPLTSCSSKRAASPPSALCARSWRHIGSTYSGNSTSSSHLFCPGATQKLIAVPMLIRSRLRVHIEVHDFPPVCGVVSRPLRHVAAVRITGAGEIGPVCLHQVTEFLILGLPDRVAARVQRAENIIDFVGMECARPRRMIFVRRRRSLEMIAINRRTARCHLRFQPFPCAESNEAVAGKING